MKILAITSRLPYPLIDGARIVINQVITGLAKQGHELHVIAVEDQEFNAGPVAQLAQIHTVRYQSVPKPVGAFLSLFSRQPYSQAKRDRPEVYRLIDELQQKHRFDVVYADQAHIAQYGAYAKQKYGLPYVLRSHNVEHEIYRRYTVTMRNPLMKAFLEMQSSRWADFEIAQTQLSDACAAITRRDQEILQRFAPDVPMTTVPAGVDMDAFPFVPVERRRENAVLLLGNMGWPPNRDAALWFAREIFPRIRRHVPDATAHLVGAEPPVKELAGISEGLVIEGRAENIRDFYDTVTVGLVPLRVGGGMRVKIVEMMASGLPVVSTSQGAEGNEATPGRHYLAADSAEEFAAAVVDLLKNRERREQLSMEAQAFVREFYSIEGVSRRFEALLVETIERKKTANRTTAS